MTPDEFLDKENGTRPGYLPMSDSATNEYRSGDPGPDHDCEDHMRLEFDDDWGSFWMCEECVLQMEEL